MRQLLYPVCYTRYHVLFYLWLIGSVLNHCKVPKYYDQDCRNYFLEEVKQNELISSKLKKVCTSLNYIENVLILASIITGCISISAFASLISIPIGITSSAIGLKDLCNNYKN